MTLGGLNLAAVYVWDAVQHFTVEFFGEIECSQVASLFPTCGGSQDIEAAAISW